VARPQVEARSSGYRLRVAGRSARDSASTHLRVAYWAQRRAAVKEGVDFRAGAACVRATPRSNISPSRASWTRMDLGRAEGRVHTTVSYGSRSVTAAFVLKATAAFSDAPV
ncbi:MAG TPA: hypothetical protein VM733_20255, partial [Thermoanaerobaculia bacterium]|nr:hypothetical protein [Thermoanaerobaculia bacterium]